MSRIVFNCLALATFVSSLSGCGLTQSVRDETASTTRAIFHKQLNTLNLELRAPAGDRDTAGATPLSVPTLVRIYQLRDGKAMERATYEGVLGDHGNLLRDGILDTQAMVVKPGETTQLSVPLHKAAQVIAVVGLFHEPDAGIGTWRLLLDRDELRPDQARVIELGDNLLKLPALAKE